MTEAKPAKPNPGPPEAPPSRPQKADGAGRSRGWLVRLLFVALVISLVFNLALYSSYQEYFADVAPPEEKFHSGDVAADDKIAIVEIQGTIMPPFTERILKALERAENDDRVKGVLLSIDSPGGLVADSHQIYHKLSELRKKKPIYVAMKRIAASGGVYVAMGAGEEALIYAEPTTWTGSIGVIIPHYDLTTLAEKLGVQSEPLKTGALKDSLSPFRELTAAERDVWQTILQDSFERFVHVIADNRSQLDETEVKALATGQVYTANQALEHGLVDRIGYEEDAIEALKKKLQLETVRVVTYATQPALIDLLLGSMEANQPENRMQRLLNATVPQAMYLCSWAPAIPALPL